MIARNCPNCGAPIPEHSFHCDYCGSSFKEEGRELIIVERSSLPIEILQAECRIDRRMYQYGDIDHIAGMVWNSLSQEIAKNLQHYMEVKSYPSFQYDEDIYTARIRVIPPSTKL